MQNKVQLITYVDRLGGGNFAQLRALLQGPLQGLFGGVHLLPFFFPIDGADAGFDPIDHTQVDARLGDWTDLAALGQDLDVMADVIVNHMSSASPQFQDWAQHGAASASAGLFLTYDTVFPQGATQQDLLAIYRPRPGLPFTAASCGGQRQLLWTTFTPQQVDIDVQHPSGQRYLTSILETFAANGIRAIRLDAAGYAIKKAGGSCFMMPQTFEFIDAFAAQARALGIEVLVEIHAHASRQIEVAKRVDWVYDFALPPLVLHAFFFQTADYLKSWIAQRPNNALNVLDTHDGIGIIDIGADASDRIARPGLVPPQELDQLVERVHTNSQGQSRAATGAAASNLDLYQVNCSFYDALGRDDRSYLLARAIQFFMPGIPQVYYVGLLAGHNDMDLLAHTAVGRDINRHRYSQDEITHELQRPVVEQLLALIRLRNAHPAFNGAFALEATTADMLTMVWTAGAHHARLTVNFADLSHAITYSESGQSRVVQFGP